MYKRRPSYHDSIALHCRGTTSSRWRHLSEELWIQWRVCLHHHSVWAARVSWLAPSISGCLTTTPQSSWLAVTSFRSALIQILLLCSAEIYLYTHNAVSNTSMACGYISESKYIKVYWANNTCCQTALVPVQPSTWFEEQPCQNIWDVDEGRVTAEPRRETALC